MEKTIAVNAGSSTLKFKLFEMPSEKLISSGSIDRIGLGKSNVSIKFNGKKFKDVQDINNHSEAIKLMLDKLISLKIVKNYNEITGVGHRVVAGGEEFNDSVVVTDDVMKKLEKLSELAPLHEPANILGIKAFKKILPNVINVAVFDTAFHHTIPEKNYLYGFPYKYYQKYGARKYGAHGTSYRYVSKRASKMLHKPLKNLKLIIMHIGAGASICAIDHGKSIDTSMGFTPLTGIMMATRSGDIDPSVVSFVMEKEHIKNPNDMISILNSKSGLAGVSGVSADMRELEKVMAHNHRAMLAREMFKNRIIRYIGQYIAEMNGVDAIVFTAGVGENDIGIRQEVTDKLSYFGIDVDPKKNHIRGQERDISSSNAKVKTLLIPTNEELMIVRDVERLKNASK